MRITLLKKTTLLSLLIFGVQSLIFGQNLAPWTDNPYGNEWIQDFTKKYVRITVAKDGMYKIPSSKLTAEFSGVPLSQFQLWYRGQKVAIGFTADNGIIFYGLKNDGASDGLMFRSNSNKTAQDPSARLNPYTSFFSDLGSYFLTTGSGAVNFDTPIDGSNISGTAESYHIQKDIKTFQVRFSHFSFGVEISRNPSYYSELNSWNTEAIAGKGGRISSTTKLSVLDIPNFNLINWVNSPDVGPNLDLMISGLNEGTHFVRAYINNATSKLPANPDVAATNDGLSPNPTPIAFSFNPFSGYGGRKKNVNLDPALFNADGTGFARLISTLPGTPADNKDWFGVSYSILSYPQMTIMNAQAGNVSSAKFNFKKASNASIKVTVTGAPLGALLFDISDPYKPKPILGSQSGSILNVMLSVKANEEFNLLVVDPSSSAGIITVVDTDVNQVNFKPAYASFEGNELTPNVIEPAKYDYIIITHDFDRDGGGTTYSELLTSSIKYGKYRSSTKGGSYNTLIVNIKDIYDQFNFGEPSPIAIKRFVNYMLQGSPARARHNLFLIGHGISYPPNLLKEMKGEVPTFGDPGSDVLLVSGIAGSDIDVQAIPIGRLNAFNNTDIDNYLGKVMAYEDYSGAQDHTYRKNIINYIGAESSGEQSSFSSFFNDVNSSIPADRIPLIKSVSTNSSSYSTGIATSVVAPDINAGAGLLSYFGHGSISTLWISLGLASNSIYSNNNKYPVLYINGCEAGDVFYDRTQQFFGSNWVLTPNKGSIATISTSYRAYYPDATQLHMNPFYAKLFAFEQGGTIGRILKEVSEGLVGSGSGRVLAASSTTREHISQLVLLGDPAITMLTTASPLPVGLINFKANLLDNDKINLTWRTTWESNNSHFIIERSRNAKEFEAIGTVDGKGNTVTETEYTFVDTIPWPGINYYRLVQVDGEDNLSKEGKKSISKIVKGEIPLENIVNVFPNPVKGKIEVKLASPLKLRSWNLINDQGIIVKKGQSVTLEIGALSDGIYILEVTTNEGEVYRKKLVKE